MRDCVLSRALSLINTPVTFVVGELQGGPGTVAAIEQGHCDADYFVNCEPSDVRAITMHAESEIFEIALTLGAQHEQARGSHGRHPRRL